MACHWGKGWFQCQSSIFLTTLWSLSANESWKEKKKDISKAYTIRTHWLWQGKEHEDATSAPVKMLCHLNRWLDGLVLFPQYVCADVWRLHKAEDSLICLSFWKLKFCHILKMSFRLTLKPGRTASCSSSTWPGMIDELYLKKTFQHFLRQLLFGRQNLTNFFNLYLAALTIVYQLLIGNIWNTFLLF